MCGSSVNSWKPEYDSKALFGLNMSAAFYLSTYSKY